MPIALLGSRFATLEPLQANEPADIIDVTWSPDRQIDVRSPNSPS